MATIKCKVALIHQTPRQGEDGEPAWTTHVKLTPVGIAGGDIFLSFAKADVTFHPRHELRDDKNPRVLTKIMIADESLIQSATVYVKGEKLFTFEAGYPAHPGHMDISPQISPLAAREAPVIELNFGPAT